MNILVVDDEKVQIESLKRGLRQKGFEVTVALSAKEALRHFEHNDNKIDLVLSDYAMPEMNGLELLEKIRKANPFLPVVMMTGYGEKSLVVKAMRQRCNGFIEKPFHVDQLCCEIEGARANQKRNEEVYRNELEKMVQDRTNELKQTNERLIGQIKEHKQTEEALRESEEKYRSMMESMNDPAYISSPDYRVEYMNPAMVKRTGRDAIGEACYKVINKLDKKCPFCVHDKVQEGMYTRTEIVSPKDNRTYSVSHSPIHHVDGSISKLSVYQDITEIKNMEQQLGQAQKLEAIATLAGGVAHQFNNALSSITAHTGLLEMELPDDGKIMDYVKAMKASAYRMVGLTSQLLAYTREGKYNPQIISLSDYVKGALPLIQHTLDPNIRVEMDLPLLDILNVEADRTQMQMALLAIVANANEAIEGPGRIRISIRQMDLDQESIKDHPGLTPGPYVCLSIEDDGKGMDEETRRRIFDPFFTTHFMGRGLGMAAVYGIIKGHDGWISVDSEPGKGTVVRIYLPAIEPEKEVFEA